MTMPRSTEERRRQLLSLLAQKQGFHGAPQSAMPVTPPAYQPAPTGFQKFISGAGEALKTLTSGESAANAVGRAVGVGNVGTTVRRGIESIPVVGKPLAWAADVATSPLTLATAGFGGVLGGGIRAATAGGRAAGFGRFVAPLVEPMAQKTLAGRVAADVAMQAGGQGAYSAADMMGLPEPVKMVAGLAGGLTAARTVSNVAKRSAASLGGLSPEEVKAGLASEDPLDRVTSMLSSAKNQRDQLETVIGEERRARIGKIKSATAGVTDPQEALHRTRSAQKGELPKAAFEYDMTTITPDDLKAVHQKAFDFYTEINRYDDRANATEALNKLFTGQVINESQIGLLQQALGPKFAGVVSNIANPKSLLSWQTAADVIGLPRAIMSSMDFSMPFRQGAVGYTRPGFWKAWKPMLDATRKQEVFDGIMKEAATDMHPGVVALRKNGALTGLPTGGLKGMEEGYMTALNDMVPGVKQSARGATAFLTKQRMDYVKGVMADWDSMGKVYGEKDIDDIARVASIVTGRGELPANMGQFATTLNNLFFSPKFIASRMQMLNPKTYMSMTPLARKELMKDVASYYGLGMAGLGAFGVAAKAGIIKDANVELDPRSSDFGKFRIGTTRIDPWAGFQPLARYAAQLVAGEGKNSYGEISERNRATTLLNFARSKAAPVPSFLIDALMGTSFTGEEVDIASGQGVDRALAERMVPLLIQDMAEAFRVDGPMGMVKAAPAAVGVGVQTYRSVAAIRAAGAQEIYKKQWNELTGMEQAKVEEAYKDVIARQASPTGGLTQFIEQEDDGLRKDSQSWAGAVERQELRNKDFTAAMQDRMAERVNRIKGVMDYEKVDAGTDPTLLDRYFSLRDSATVNGRIDYELLDDLQAEFVGKLPQDEQRVITERTGFAHAPEVKWWTDAREKINESGYYKLRGEALDLMRPVLAKVAPGVETYEQLIRAAGTAESPGQAAMLTAVIKKADGITKKMQMVKRAKDKELDTALGLVYGSPSIFTRKR